MTNHIYHEQVEDLHDLFAQLFLIMVIAHLSGLVVHHIRHKDQLWKSMITGEKNDKPDDSFVNNDTIPNSTRPKSALLFFVILVGWFSYAFTRYDSTANSLTFPFLELKFDDDEQSKSADNNRSTKNKEEEDDDDDDRDRRRKHDRDHD